MANPYIPKLGPSAATALPGLPRRKSTAVTSISAAFNWQLPVDYSGKFKLVSAQASQPEKVRFSADGFEMYILGDTSNTVYQYSLTVALDVSTAVYASKSFLFTTQDTDAKGLAFSVDGTKMYMVGFTNNTVYQYTLSTAWDVSTAAYASKSIDVTAQDGSPIDLAFSFDGLTMFVLGSGNDTVYQYTLTVSFDVSTASYASKSLLVNTLTTPEGIFLSASGSEMYVLSSGNDTVHQITLVTANDVSTGVIGVPNVIVTDEELSPRGVTFSTDGANMYIVGLTSDTVYQYTVGDYT